MTEFETTSLILAGVGAGASIISAFAASVAAVGIWHGIRAMVRANKDRAGILDRQYEADERRHTEVMRRHDEAMRRHDEAMQAADQRHDEATRAADQRHDEAMAALADQRREAADQRRALEALIAGMETMIERTAPKPGPSAPAE